MRCPSGDEAGSISARGYPPTLMFRDILAFLGTALTCASYITGLGWLARQSILEQHLSRKVMHIGDPHIHACMHACVPLGLATPHVGGS